MFTKRFPTQFYVNIAWVVTALINIKLCISYKMC